MNQCIVDLLNDPEKLSHFTLGLPEAFEVVEKQLPSNSAQGLLREQVIIGYFRFMFGGDEVILPSKTNERNFDVTLCGEDLAIKTVTGNSRTAIKVHWTSDNQRVEEEIATYYPKSDFLWITIHWNKTADSIFYIPLSVQIETHNTLGDSGYLARLTGTNNRGIPLSKEAFSMLKEHPDTLRRKVTWARQGVDFDPHEEWETYWKRRHSD